MATISGVARFSATTAALFSNASDFAAGGLTETVHSLWATTNAPFDYLISLKCAQGDTSATGVVSFYYSWAIEDGTASYSATAVSTVHMNFLKSFSFTAAEADKTQQATVTIPVEGNLLHLRAENSTSGSVTFSSKGMRVNIRDNQA